MPRRYGPARFVTTGRLGPQLARAISQALSESHGVRLGEAMISVSRRQSSGYPAVCSTSTTTRTSPATRTAAAISTAGALLTALLYRSGRTDAAVLASTVPA
jgi:hypothetical protein